MLKIVPFQSLSDDQTTKYSHSTVDSYPAFLDKSMAIQKYWSKMENYFPDYQLMFLDEEGALIGFMNTLPFNFRADLSQLPHEGWDWLLQQATEGYEQNIPPNCLGGIQINVLEEYRGRGYSTEILKAAKRRFVDSSFDNFLIPIRPIWKDRFPLMSMDDYMYKTEHGRIYDPWIRTHLKKGAEIVKVCNNSMNVRRKLDFWMKELNLKELPTGNLFVEGCLNPIWIDKLSGYGEYREENIWIRYRK